MLINNDNVNESNLIILTYVQWDFKSTSRLKIAFLEEKVFYGNLKPGSVFVNGRGNLESFPVLRANNVDGHAIQRSTRADNLVREPLVALV